MSEAQTQYQVEAGVALVTLSRPDKLNAWTQQMAAEVRAHMLAANADDAARVIVLTGAGRGFCAGADLEDLKGATSAGEDGLRDVLLAKPPELEVLAAEYRLEPAYLAALDKPVIAALNGPTVGLGLVVSLFCDLRFASESARLSTAFARLGLVAEYGVAWQLPRLIGMANAADLLFSARQVNAHEARELGLVNRVLPDEGFLDGVLAYARDMAATVSPRSLRAIKRQLYAAQGQTLGESMQDALMEMLAGFGSEDFQEGVGHFLERRPANFSGK